MTLLGSLMLKEAWPIPTLLALLCVCAGLAACARSTMAMGALLSFGFKRQGGSPGLWPDHHCLSKQQAGTLVLRKINFPLSKIPLLFYSSAAPMLQVKIRCWMGEPLLCLFLFEFVLSNFVAIMWNTAESPGTAKAANEKPWEAFAGVLNSDAEYVTARMKHSGEVKEKKSHSELPQFQVSWGVWKLPACRCCPTWCLAAALLCLHHPCSMCHPVYPKPGLVPVLIFMVYNGNYSIIIPVEKKMYVNKKRNLQEGNSICSHANQWLW